MQCERMRSAGVRRAGLPVCTEQASLMSTLSSGDGEDWGRGKRSVGEGERERERERESLWSKRLGGELKRTELKRRMRR